MRYLYNIVTNNVKVHCTNVLLQTCNRFGYVYCWYMTKHHVFLPSMRLVLSLTGIGRRQLCLSTYKLTQGVMATDVNKVPTPAKPPNVFVYIGPNENADIPGYFNVIREHLLLCLNPDSYVIYPLLPSQVEKFPWQENTALLVVSTKYLPQNTLFHILKFFESGGNILSLNGAVFNDKSTSRFDYGIWRSVATFRTEDECMIKFPNALRTVIAEDGNGKSEIVKFSKASANFISSSVQLILDPVKATADKETFTVLQESAVARLGVLRDILEHHFCMDCESQKIPECTPVFLLSKNEDVLRLALKTFSHHWSRDKSLRLKRTTLQFTEGEGESPKPTVESVPVLLGKKPQPDVFDEGRFFQTLATKKLGRLVFYSEVVGSTMNLIDGLTDLDGIVCISSRQIDGKGRGGNQWLSPPGCAMFTVHLKFPLHSNLGQSLPFVQHLMTLSVVTAVRSLPGYEELDLRIKWPNDIYFGNAIKLGGVIVTSTLMADSVHCYIGTGVNLDNRNPTVCINDVIALHNRDTGSCLPPLKVEELIAMILGRMEENVDRFQKGEAESCTRAYYKYWMHNDQELTLEAIGGKAKVQGVDDCGFLVVKTESGEVVTLQPDGNSLDLMTGMSIVRTK